MSLVTEIADRAVTTIADATLSIDIESENIRRVYIPVYDPTKDVDGEPLEIGEDAPIIISVVPFRLDAVLLDRGGRQTKTYDIDIGIQKLVGSGTMTAEEFKEACDPLLNLAEEIADLFVGIAYDTTPAVRCFSSKNQPIYDLEHLNKNRVFTGVVRATFRYSG